MAASNALSLPEFSALLQTHCPALGPAHPIAIAVSGGPDSLALTKLLSDWAAEQGRGHNSAPTIHVLTVDHGLRPDAAQEASALHEQIKSWPHITHTILHWEGEKPDTRIQEEARKARYDLMAAHCRAHDIAHLVLAHHADDQGETLLFRLAKGSGLDGLAAMRAVQPFDENITLIRPFLNIEKSRLIATCEEYGLDYARDPTNFCETYARPRLRAAREVLEAEGLTTKRLSVTAARLDRAREALDQIAEDMFKKAKISDAPLTLNWRIVKQQPEEIALRVLIKSIQTLKPEEDYLPRMEKLEDLLSDLLTPTPFRKRTLGGIVFERDEKAQTVILSLET